MIQIKTIYTVKNVYIPHSKFDSYNMSRIDLEEKFKEAFPAMKIVSSDWWESGWSLIVEEHTDEL